MSICKQGRCEVMIYEDEGSYCKSHNPQPQKTLLEKAKEFKPRVQKTNRITEEHIDLLIAYLKGEIQQSAVAYSIYGNAKNTSVYSFLMKAVFEAIEQGRITLEK